MENTLKLMSETIFNSLTVVNEAKEDGKDLYIEGIYMQAEQKNRNGRIYPSSVLEREINAYNTNYIQTKRAMGELNHPPRPNVDAKEASHLITEIKKTGNDFIGKAKILNTPAGNIVKGLIEGGVNLGVSSRGLGSLKEGTGNYRGAKIVQNDFKLVTVDIVSDPSAPDAWVNGIYESVDYIIQEGTIQEYNVEEAKRLRDIALLESKIPQANKIANAKALYDAIIALK